MSLSDNRAGFTLLEVLLVVSMIAVLGGISATSWQSIQRDNELNLAAQQVAAGARRAETLAQASDGDSTWGVTATATQVVVFKGASFAARDQTVDEVFDLNSTVSVSGTSEYVFQKLTGLPQTAGVLTLQSTSGKTQTVTISASGMVQY